MSAGIRHTCLRSNDSTVVCWGENDFGQTDAPTGAGFAQVSAGTEHSCAVRENGSIVFSRRLTKPDAKFFATDALKERAPFGIGGRAGLGRKFKFIELSRQQTM